MANDDVFKVACGALVGGIAGYAGWRWYRNNNPEQPEVDEEGNEIAKSPIPQWVWVALGGAAAAGVGAYALVRLYTPEEESAENDEWGPEANDPNEPHTLYSTMANPAQIAENPISAPGGSRPRPTNLMGRMKPAGIAALSQLNQAKTYRNFQNSAVRILPVYENESTVGQF